MKTDQFGQPIFDENDLCNLVMQGTDLISLKKVIVDPLVDLDNIKNIVEDVDSILKQWGRLSNENISVSDWDRQQQSKWLMPDEYKQLDIAAYVLSLCKTDAELQRVGEELLLFQERDLFDLLRYLKYLVDSMTQHRLIWGVGRGSSVASYVLYLLKVHRIDSMYYNLDVHEFLR